MERAMGLLLPQRWRASSEAGRFRFIPALRGRSSRLQVPSLMVVNKKSSVHNQAFEFNL